MSSLKKITDETSQPQVQRSKTVLWSQATRMKEKRTSHLTYISLHKKKILNNKNLKAKF